jgi:nitroimidazol reductase NimA-like FMN-containing flavoprotein (pyridoxamine 5'-phosphate oxidase superfamily)
MPRQLRRKDRAISAERALQILSQGEFGVLSTVDAENQPYGVPVNYVVRDNRVEFHCATSGHKIDNIQHNDKVSFCVVGETKVLPSEFSTKYESVIVFGTISELAGSAKRDSLVFLIAKYSPEHIEAGMKYIERSIEKTKVYSIIISAISGKAHQ